MPRRVVDGIVMENIVIRIPMGASTADPEPAMNTIAASVVVPIRNEEKYIGTCLKSLLEQSLPCDSYEIIVVDGRSSDRSKEIVEQIQHDFPSVRCLDNPAAIAPVAMNIGIRNARGKVIIRADGHNFYPRTYIENCVKYLDQTGADNVGGPWLTVPADKNFGARLVAAILSNPFGVGGSRFRTSQADGFVETVPFGAFRRDLFDRIGLYNEKLVRNQDNELNARILAAGGKIYQTSALQTEYHPVASFSQLLVQIFKTSQWHVFSIRENKRSMGFRHLAPSGFVLVVLALLSLSWFSKLAGVALIALMAVYMLAGSWVAVGRRRDWGWGIVSIMPLASFGFHFAYGLGTLAGLRYLFKSPPSTPIRSGQPVNKIN
jgi:glycosyltransferase involved in cell wall biosynthesis